MAPDRTDVLKNNKKRVQKMRINKSSENVANNKNHFFKRQECTLSVHDLA